jgi:hypothetical protein
VVTDSFERTRRFYEIVRVIIAEQGGAEQCSEGRRQLIRRFAAAAVLAEEMEERLAHGRGIDVKAYSLLVSILVRIGQCIGIDRPAKSPPTSLREYLAAKAAEKEVAQ